MADRAWFEIWKGLCKIMEGESLYTSVFVNDREIVSDREAGDDNSLDQEHERGRDK